jgi:hypothetical protein
LVNWRSLSCGDRPRKAIKGWEITAIAPVNQQEIMLAISFDSVVTINVVNTYLQKTRQKS